MKKDEIAQLLADGKPIDWEDQPTGDPVVNSLRKIQEYNRKFSNLTDSDPEPIERTMGDWGSLHLVESIGRGSFGEVFRAFDPVLQRDVALKLVRNPESCMLDTDAFISEAQRLAQVRHRNVVSVYGAGTHREEVGFWCELLMGQTLEDALSSGKRFSVEESLQIALDLVKALGAVHQSKLIHGDIKAANIMLEPERGAVLMDFGSGMVIDTQTHPLVASQGTPLVMAPELFVAEAISPESDQYAVGVLLFRLLSGDYPVTASSVGDLQRAHNEGHVRSLSESSAGLPRKLIDLVDQLLSVKPTDRPDVATTASRIRWIQDTPKRRTRIFAVSTTAVGLMVGIFLFNQLQRDTRNAEQQVRIAARESQAASAALVEMLDTTGPAIGIQNVVPLDQLEPSEEQRTVLSESRAGLEQALTEGQLDQDLVPLDEIPFQAMDLGYSARIVRINDRHNPANAYPGWREFAYDLGIASIQRNGSWQEMKPSTDPGKPGNDNYYAFGAPVYAVNDGVIVNCWRNAPDNPRPFSLELDKFYAGMPLSEQTWLHSDTRNEKIYGLGNFVVVLEESGNFVTYAHAQAGSVPETLCPHNAVFLPPASWQADSHVPVDKRQRIKRGDLVFRVGNSGVSSAPHLHLDRTGPDRASSLKFHFRTGLASPLDSNTSRPIEYDWVSFAGQPIPAGPVLVYPPLKAEKSRFWRLLNEEEWNYYSLHLIDSGYQLRFIDGYSVNGKPSFNTLWSAETAPWKGYVLLDGPGLQSILDRHGGEGLALTWIDSVLVDGQPRYNAIFVQGASMNFIAHHGQSMAEFETSFLDARSKGYSPVNVAVLSVDGDLQLTSLYAVQDIGDWELITKIAKGEYQAIYDDRSAQGKFPYYVNSYFHQDEVHFSIAFSEQPHSARVDHHQLSILTLETKYFDFGDLPIHALSGVDGAPANHEYIVVWRASE